MKTKYWIAILAVLLAVCTALSIPLLLPGESASHAEIISDGVLLHTVDLRIDRQIQIASPNGGTNTVTIQGGKIAVTTADCPDQYCVQRGFVSGGTPIVCLPHRLVIEFLGAQEIDGILG